MIVPAIPRYLDDHEIASLRVGGIHHIDSGLGGSFQVRLTGRHKDRFVFENISDGWEQQGPYRYTFHEVRQRVYRLVAENPALRRQNR